MTTRCKFKCETVTQHVGSQSVHLTPVVTGSPENQQFWQFTPSGDLRFNSLNANIVFVPGKEYFLDISDAVVVAPAVAKPK